MIDASQVVVLVTTASFVLLALVALWVHVRQRTSASRWLLITFATIGTAVGAGQLLRLMPDGQLARAVEVLTGMALLAFPYALFRFSNTFERPPPWAGAAAAGLALVVIAPLPLILDDLDGGGSLRAAYLSLVLFYWTALSLHVVVRLWRSSRGQPTVARRRLVLMGLAAAVLNGALLVSTTAAEPGQPLYFAAQGMAILSSVLFLLGFAPPAVVRRSWRLEDEEALRAAERRLLGATTRSEVLSSVLPVLEDLFGGRAQLVDADEQLAPSGSASSPSSARLVPGFAAVSGDALAVGLERGSLVVRADAYTPFFGAEEISLLRAFAASLDLALARVELLEKERSSRTAAERTNAELEALLYGITHDLRTPLVALTGYVELLGDPNGTEAEERAFVVGRVRANTAYMDALINDLLELSRVGRVNETPAPVPLDALVRELADELVLRHPQARVKIGDLPVIEMEPTRARQLISNLLNNSARHSGREDVTITVTSEQSEDGVVVSVADDGVGIAPEHRDRVFGIFERLQGRDEKQGGTGIGLAMCRKILEQVGGRVWVADAPSGTDVRFSLPSSNARSGRAVWS